MDKKYEDMSQEELKLNELTVQRALDLQARILRQLGRDEEADAVAARVPTVSSFIKRSPDEENPA